MIEDVRLWYVTVTVGGASVEQLLVRAALQRLVEQRPFLSKVRYSSERAEISYWDEATSLVDVASLALRLWNEHRESANLPHWHALGLEVVEHGVKRSRDKYAPMADLSVVPQPF